MKAPASPARRAFLQTGIAGGLLLAGVGSWYAVEVGSSAPIPGVLGDADRIIVRRIAEVVLDGVLPVEGAPRKEALASAVAGVGVAIAGLSAPAQAEIAELFSLLRFTPTRVLVAGLSHSWEKAGADEIHAFLERWRGSRLGLLQSGYAALHDLVLGAWYGGEAAWALTGYPGPPEVL